MPDNSDYLSLSEKHAFERSLNVCIDRAEIKSDKNELAKAVVNCMNHAMNKPSLLPPSVQGMITQTENAFDLAIVGPGQFIVKKDTDHINDQLLFTRKGSLSLNSEGELVNIDGFSLLGWKLPHNSTQSEDKSLTKISIKCTEGKPLGMQRSDFIISENGKVYTKCFNHPHQATYQIPLADFTNPDGLKYYSGYAYSYDENAGEIAVREAISFMGNIMSGFLESRISLYLFE